MLYLTLAGSGLKNWLFKDIVVSGGRPETTGINNEKFVLQSDNSI
jgi:hypothetical protein